MGEPADAGDDDRAPEDRALVTHEVAPDPVSESILPSDLSKAAGESDLFDLFNGKSCVAPTLDAAFKKAFDVLNSDTRKTDD